MTKNWLIVRLIHVKISSQMFITFFIIFMTPISEVKEKLFRVIKFHETVWTLGNLDEYFIRQNKYTKVTIDYSSTHLVNSGFFSKIRSCCKSFTIEINLWIKDLNFGRIDTSRNRCFGNTFWFPCFCS